MDVKLYVGNLANTTTEDDLRTLFAKAGQVTSVALITDRATGASRGFAFIEMSTRAEAEKAISMFDNSSLNDQDLKVNLARPRNPRASGFNQRSGSKRR